MSRNATTPILLAQYPLTVRRLAEETGTLLHKLLPGIEETPDFPAKMIAYGYGEGYSDTICTLILSQKEIKVGFYKGSILPDPHGLLTGSGKVHRYVTIAHKKQLNMAFTDLVRAAYGAYRMRTESSL
jgi:hypothetical protein